MTERRIELTDRSVHRLALVSSGETRVHDAEVRGFFVRVGTRTKTFMVKGEHWRHGVRVFSVCMKLADCGEVSAREARVRARDVLGMIARGERPDVRGGPPIASAPATTMPLAAPINCEAPVMAGVTLREAWDRYLVSHLLRKQRSEGTIAHYSDHVERLLSDWLDIPLKELADDPDRVARKHDQISEVNGPYIANGAMRSLRAIYNHAWKRAKRVLPPDNPVDAVDWNPQERRNTAMGQRDLPGWFAELAALDNPIRREFHLFTLLSASRPTALKHVRPQDLDLRRRVLHVANPKGGPKRAFDIPLSREMILCLARAIRFGRFLYPLEAESWLFPATSESGHLVETKEDRTELSKWGNDLRQTFRTLATLTHVSEVDAKLLMNHKLTGVNEGYITRHKLLDNHLRSQQQAISSVMFAPVRSDLSRSGVLGAWLGPGAARRLIAASALGASEAAHAVASATLAA